jgi:elongator complex protein 2
MVSVSTDYISVGGNRHPGAADWDVQSGVLAYGADNNVALWEPLVGSLGPDHRGFDPS